MAFSFSSVEAEDEYLKQLRIANLIAIAALSEATYGNRSWAISEATKALGK